MKHFNLVPVFVCALLSRSLSAALEECPLGYSSNLREYDGSDSGKGGAAHTPLVRACPANYPGDGSGEDMDYHWLPNERTVSNTCMKQSGLHPNKRMMSDMVWAWGQFLDHDISLTEPGKEFGTAPIPVLDKDDPLYPGPIKFDRSEYHPSTGVPGRPRQQMNLITSYIDASNVYGSDKERAAFLRTFKGGKLKTSTGNLLPFNTAGLPNAGGPSPDQFIAGDIRANEQVGLASMHTLFVREHNRLAELISKHCAYATDEAIYQMARKIMGAEMQIITYNEFLPALLGKHAPKLSDYKGWDKSINAGIMNEFSTAIYRVGHTMLSPTLKLATEKGVVDSIPLQKAFFNVTYLTDDPSRVDQLLNGFQYQKAQEIDMKLVEDIRSLLFKNGPTNVGMDLASLNLRRGRDHGLASYNVVRKKFGLRPARQFSDITSNGEWADKLAKVYESVDDVELWIGALAEDHLEGASVGELLKAVMVSQFTKLRDGDRYFYLNDRGLRSKKVQTIINLSEVTLAKVIEWNTVFKTQEGSVFLAKDTKDTRSIKSFCKQGLQVDIDFGTDAKGKAIKAGSYLTDLKYGFSLSAEKGVDPRTGWRRGFVKKGPRVDDSSGTKGKQKSSKSDSSKSDSSKSDSSKSDSSKSKSGSSRPTSDSPEAKSDEAKPTSDESSNWQSFGNVLVVQERKTKYIKANRYGGSIVLDFDQPTDIKALRLLEKGTPAVVTVSVDGKKNDSVIQREHETADGESSIVRVETRKVNRIKIWFEGPGALASIWLCAQCVNSTKKKDKDLGCTKHNPFCVASNGSKVPWQWPGAKCIS